MDRLRLPIETFILNRKTAVDPERFGKNKKYIDKCYFILPQQFLTFVYNNRKSGLYTIRTC